MEPYISLDSTGFSPEEFIDVKRCLETLLSVREGSQPKDREFGINIDEIVGYPQNVARNMLSIEIIEKVRIYEPRVEVQSVDFDMGEDGQIKPIIYFTKSEE